MQKGRCFRVEHKLKLTTNLFNLFLYKHCCCVTNTRGVYVLKRIYMTETLSKMVVVQSEMKPILCAGLVCLDQVTVVTSFPTEDTDMRSVARYKVDN